jgi:phage-related protein
MSDFNYQPAFNAQITKAPRVLNSRFGDGYEQRIGDGINTTPQVWQVTFQAAESTIEAIDDFLSAKGGVDSFTWTPSGFSEIRVKCADWSREITAPNAGRLSAKFEQVFE